MWVVETVVTTGVQAASSVWVIGRGDRRAVVTAWVDRILRGHGEMCRRPGETVSGIGAMERYSWYWNETRRRLEWVTQRRVGESGKWGGRHPGVVGGVG